MKKIQTTISVHDTLLDLASFTPDKTLAEIIDISTLRLLSEMQRSTPRGNEIYRRLVYQKQVGRQEQGYKRICVRLLRQVWEYCEMAQIKKGVFVNQALRDYYGQKPTN